jgi:hypothetical protein
MTTFYTYLHCRPDGTPFYVGKGSGPRSNDFRRRNIHHRNIVAKYGASNIGIFVFHCLSERQAFEDEARHIAQLRNDGCVLTNQTDGGEGAHGAARSPETRRKMAASKFGNTHGRANKGRPNGWSGKSLSQEHRQKIASALRGHGVSLSARAKMSAAKIGNKNRLGGQRG